MSSRRMSRIRAVSSSPTSTLCDSDSHVEDDVLTEISIWNDIDDTTPSVETWVPNGMFHRLHKMLTYSDPFESRFNIGNVPVEGCTWGEGVYESYLTYNHQLLELWAIGHMKTLWFLAAEQDPRPRARVGVELLRDVDKEAARRLMNESSPSPARTPWLATTDFCADKMSTMDKKIFQDIYDATSVYTTKKDMPKLLLTDLSIGDLVLVECCLVRGRTDRRVPGVWSTWVTAFQLRAVSLLLSRPRPDSADGMDVDMNDTLSVAL